MDKIFHSTFDFFTHALPGFCIAITFFILDPSLNTSQDFVAKANQIQIGGGVLLLVIGYAIGFAVHPIGRFLYKKIGFFIWREKIENDVTLFISDKYVMIRELSPNNFKYVETWNMFCAMSHNLAVASLMAFVVTIIKLVFQTVGNHQFWITFSIVAFVFFFIFLHRAVRFSIWAAHDLNAAVSRLKLLERSENISIIKESKEK